MFAISDRDSPCSARISPSSLGRVTVRVPSACLTSMGCTTSRERVPLGPFTVTWRPSMVTSTPRSEEHTSELQSQFHLVCRLLLEKKKLESVDDVDEIGLIGHHLVDVLVRARDLVDHALVLAADHAPGLGLQVLDGETLLRGIAAHPAARAMRARVEALRRSLAEHDVAARAHAAFFFNDTATTEIYTLSLHDALPI